MEQIFAVHGVPQVVHADRGTSMTSRPSPRCSRSRGYPVAFAARVSNDNPYSESLFKT